MKVWIHRQSRENGDVTSVSLSLCIFLSLSLSHRKYLTHNIGSASALPIILRLLLWAYSTGRFLGRLCEARYKSISANHPGRGLGAFPQLFLSRPSEVSGAEEQSYAFWLSVCAASTWVFFGSGLSGESTPVYRQRRAFAASVRSKKKKNLKRRDRRRRFEGGWREGASSKEEGSSKDQV